MPDATPIAAACPICTGAARPYCTKTAQGREWHIARCGRCGHGFVVNRPTLADLTVANESESTSHPMEGLTVERYEANHDAARLSRVVFASGLKKASGRLLDVGCGDGGFSYPFWKAGYRPLLTDLDARAAAATAVMTGSEFQRVTFEDLADAGPFDVIIMSQVLEHALDPMAWLRKAAGLLAGGGRLLIALPNFGGVYRLLGARDPYLIPPVHVNFFTPASMRLALAGAGLGVIRMSSLSGLSPYRGDGSTSAGRYAFAAAMNAASLLLNRTTRGICLVTVAGRA